MFQLCYDITKNSDYDASKCAIIKHIIGVEDVGKMTLEMADKFWGRSEFSLGTPQPGYAAKLIAETVKEINNRADAQKLSHLHSEEKGYMCLIVYTMLINRSIALIRREVSRVLLRESLKLAQAAGSEDAVMEDR